MTTEDERFAHFMLDRHLDRMTAIVEQLGDELANLVPDLPGANSAYALLFHCSEMASWWTRAAVLGLEVDRDRDAEFVASGSVARLLDHVARVREQLVLDIAGMDLSAQPLGDVGPGYAGTPVGATVSGVLLHVLEELAQHHGHLELTRDWVVRAASR